MSQYNQCFCLNCGKIHYDFTSHRFSTWWRHQMETFSALLAICAVNLPVPGEFPAQRPVTRSFDVFFDLRRNKRMSKQSWGWWFETLSRSLWRHCNEFSCFGIQHPAYCFPANMMLSIWYITVLWLPCYIFIITPILRQILADTVPHWPTILSTARISLLILNVTIVAMVTLKYSWQRRWWSNDRYVSSDGDVTIFMPVAMVA